jgi:hypothetical protein
MALFKDSNPAPASTALRIFSILFVPGVWRDSASLMALARRVAALGVTGVDAQSASQAGARGHHEANHHQVGG